jgi:ubiquitin-conjugating enzyme E2 Q
MPRKQFRADLHKAQESVAPPGAHNIRAGDDDGQFDFEFTDAASGGASCVNITAVVTDLGDYPSSHEYMLFCGEDAPHHIAKTLQEVRNTGRKTVYDLIQVVSASLCALTPDSDGDLPMGESVSDDDEQYDEDEDADDIYGDDDEAFSFGGPVPTAATAHLPTTPQANAANKGDRSFRDRVRSDLHAAKEAGFRVGHLGSLLEGYSSFVTVSIRMSKLGISEEAMQAWKVDPTEYLILVIQYPNGYKTNEQFQAYDSIRLKPNIGMRVFAGKRYKPTLQEAIKAFTKARKDRTSGGGDTNDRTDTAHEESSIHETFISRPLSTLLEENLVPILRFRSTGMDWGGSEAWNNDIQKESSIVHGDPNVVPDKYYEPEAVSKLLPNVMHGDQYRQRDIVKYSFPTLAMQFALRHFVRCTEFCLVCHCKLDSELEAIKPYVCERPLCLFQYMSLGFGPSIEHEIITQPYVVDLLISFCYSSANSRKLKEFPDGLNLMGPPLAWQDAPKSWTGYDTPSQEQNRTEKPGTLGIYEVGFDRARREIIFFNRPNGGCPVARGQWIVIRSSSETTGGIGEELHCRVSETNFYPTLSVDEPVVVPITPTGMASANANGGATTPVVASAPVSPTSTPRWTPASFSAYSQDFDDLNQTEKCQAICKLLDTLPTVDEMRKYLSQHHPTDLRSWVERMPRDATNLLRWIIASNRACIMQVEAEGGENAKGTISHKEERLHGADGYMQFRFAMGAPDKESRFVSEVRKTTDRLNLKYPTIFAWHGSPLFNWHMIIREGLHFKNADHGRAYGNGVYHAKDAATSTGYSGMGGHGYGYNAGGWSKSMLRISTALALNEIVNAPGEFVSSKPYYVVSQLDWVQTRYLLVKCAPTDENIKPGVEVMPKEVHPQDPHQTPKGPMGGPIAIPASAIKSGRLRKETQMADKDDKRRPASSVGSTSKKLKDGLGHSVATAIEIDDSDTASIDTDIEDLAIFIESEEKLDVAIRPNKTQSKSGSKDKISSESTTDFVPCSLDFSTLPVMPLPTYATSATTKRLMSELGSLAKVQDNHSLASLGWSIDTEKIENVYQWIVELHSFHTFSINDKPLPLVEDMKKANATSIVLEIRFGPDFPFSPPYIRVIRPRFLPFTQGGGGHIVIGGAMCMELLTNSGWSSVMSMESVLMQVRMAIASEPFARLEGKGQTIPHRSSDYGAAEAAEGYIRACASHGWQVPPGFREVAQGMRSAHAGAGAGANT